MITKNAVYYYFLNEDDKKSWMNKQKISSLHCPFNIHVQKSNP